jgi:membrane protein DedA with SNARE-associated domain
MFFNWIVTAISAMGYAGIVGLMALESACFPIPSEIIMPFSGYLAFTGRFSLLGVTLAGTAGCSIGSTAAYWAGAYGGRPAVLRWGRYLLFGPRELDKLDRLFARFGGGAAFISRLLPGVRTFISLPAGIAHMPFVRFQAYTIAGSLPWCFALAFLGYTLGEQWNSNPEVKAILSGFDWVVAGCAFALFAYYVYSRFRAANR